MPLPEPQRGGQLIQPIHAPTLMILRRGQDASEQVPLHWHEVAAPVEVSPLQREQFAGTHAGTQTAQQAGMPFREPLACDRDDVRRFVARERIDDGSWASPLSRVGLNVESQLMDQRRMEAQAAMLCAPLVCQYCPESLIQALSTTSDGSPKEGFLDRAKLLQRAIPSSVEQGRSSLEAMDTECREREFERELGAPNKQTRAPVWRAERESPFGRGEAIMGRTNLEQTHGDIVPGRHDRETHVQACCPLPIGPIDEPLEALHARRRRRNKARDFFGRQQLK